MNLTDPFPKIMLEPCNFNNMKPLEKLTEKQCEERIKIEFLSHMEASFIAHRYKYPTDPKEISIIPFSKLEEARGSGYKPLAFSMLWLPSAALNISEIRTIVPDELKENPIVGCDYYSILKGDNILRIDPGFGEALFILNKNQMIYPHDWQFLAEHA